MVALSSCGSDFVADGVLSNDPIEWSCELQVTGMFWNYFSVGMDAASAHRFHQLRESRPWATTGRRVNQFWYTYFGFATGWMLGAAPLRNKVSLRVRTTRTRSTPLSNAAACPATCRHYGSHTCSLTLKWVFPLHILLAPYISA